MKNPHSTRIHGVVPELVSANRIAKILKRTTRAVIDAIVREGIEPVTASGTMKLYAGEAIERVRTAMRAPNKARKEAHTAEG